MAEWAETNTDPEGRSALVAAWSLRLELVRRQKLTLLEWSEAFRMEEGEPLDFEAFPFQRELYQAFGDRDLPSVDVMKSAQCGISAAAVSLALYAADVWGANVLYVLPTTELAESFSDTRVRPAIASSPYLSGRLQETNTKSLKQLGVANIYFTGSGSDRQAISVPADLLVLDEYDRLDRPRLPLFDRRLASPKSMKLRRRFSNPSYPEDGIHGLYLASDQRTWLIRCRRCRHEAPISYEQIDGSHYLREEDAKRVCGRCGRPLGPGVIAAGRWVAARPEQSRRGYHVSRLIVPGDVMAELVAEHAKGAEDEIAAHYNFDLGLPFAPRGGSLDRDRVLACRREWTCPSSYRGSQWVTAGVDVGGVLHVRISAWSEQGAVPLFIGEVPDFEALELLWNAYNVNFGLIDERPEERKARDFCDRFRGRAKMIRWSGDEQRHDIVEPEGERLVIVRRTWAMDTTVAEVTAQTRLLPKDLPRGYLAQMTSPHRVTETQDKTGRKVTRYVHTTADDYFLAETHDVVARLAHRGSPVGFASSGPVSIREEVRRRLYGAPGHQNRRV
jgi:hypothetical protein